MIHRICVPAPKKDKVAVAQTRTEDLKSAVPKVAYSGSTASLEKKIFQQWMQVTLRKFQKSGIILGTWKFKTF